MDIEWYSFGKTVSKKPKLDNKFNKKEMNNINLEMDRLVKVFSKT
ncbi:hypothetical protein LEP1GSC196_0683 [Leptospira meyeri serovar Semaranga str. Veldrot Semarang 173]|nr:hypothetical protein LEP1GSC196_0683 [Leptospira meyeri serovar Semaranga str. Veldrot Semarang 173]